MRILAAIAVAVVVTLTVSAYPNTAASSAEGAIQWAQAQVGSHDYDGWCLTFVQAAFRGPNSAADAWSYYLQLGQPNSGARPADVPRGALVFFRDTSSNPYGHVGIALGGGDMISALNALPRTGIQVTAINWVGNFVGWSYAPSSWPGRETVSPTSPAIPTATTVTAVPATLAPASTLLLPVATPQPATAAPSPTLARVTPGPAPVAVTSPPTLAPVVATSRPTSAPSASDIFGAVVWGTTPMVGWPVTLWTGTCGATGPGDRMVSAVTTGSDGRYRFTNVGPGPFSVVVTPQSSDYVGGGVRCGVYPSTADLTWYMAKQIQTLAPPSYTTVAGPNVTLVWQTFSGADSYGASVMLCDSNSCRSIVLQKTSAPTYTFTGAVAGRTYNWIGYAYSSQCGGCIIANTTVGSFKVAGP